MLVNVFDKKFNIIFFNIKLFNLYLNIVKSWLTSILFFIKNNILLGKYSNILSTRFDLYNQKSYAIRLSARKILYNYKEQGKSDTNIIWDFNGNVINSSDLNKLTPEDYAVLWHGFQRLHFLTPLVGDFSLLNSLTNQKYSSQGLGLLENSKNIELGVGLNNKIQYMKPTVIIKNDFLKNITGNNKVLNFDGNMQINDRQGNHFVTLLSEITSSDIYDSQSFQKALYSLGSAHLGEEQRDLFSSLLEGEPVGNVLEDLLKKY